MVKTLGLMNVSQIRDYFMIIMMFKSIHGLVPEYVMRLLCSGALLLEQRGPQLTVMYMCHIMILECCNNSFAYRGPVFWNALPENIKKCETLNCFKQCVKLHVVE